MSDSDTPFSDYETRFEKQVGSIQPGQYGRFNNRLVKRLSAHEFIEQTGHYEACGNELLVAIENGETLSEQLIVKIRTIEANLILEKSEYLP